MITAAGFVASVTPIATVVSTGVGIVCIVAAVLMRYVGGHHERIALVFLMTGVVGILGTPIGRGLQSFADWCDNGLNSVTVAGTGVFVQGLLAIAAVYVFVMHMWKNHVTKLTVAAGVAIPLLVGTIPGPLGTGVHTAVVALTGGVGHVVAKSLSFGR